jgi:arylsulfatase A
MSRPLGAALAVIAVAAGFAPAASAADKPNLVVFLADDLGWGDLGCYGNAVIKTPHLDRFAAEGMRFTQCYAASAVCSPSRSAILTGRTPYRNGVFTWIPEGRDIHLRRSEVTVARLLKEQGYATCHVGKWHLNAKFNSPEQPQPNDHGYDWWMATQNNAAPSHKNPVNFVRNGKPVGPMEGFSAQLVVDEGIEWLKTHRDPKKPFLLMVWTHEPHLPIESDPKFQALYPGIDDADQRQHHGNVSQLDDAFGRLMRTLDEMKLADDTLVFFTSDNGPEGAGDKGRTRGSTGGLRGRKRAVYEGGIRVPGIARFPGRIKAGTVSQEPVIGSDLFVTLAKLGGAAVPTDRVIDGADLAPVFAGKPAERSRPMYWRCAIAPGEFKTALRDGDWKIVADETLTKFELFHLGRDPKETEELSAKETAKLAELTDKLRKLNAEIEAEGPDWWKTYNHGGGAKPKTKKKAG